MPASPCSETSIMNSQVLEPSSWKLVWTPELSVGIPELGEEHRHFIELVNALNEAVLQNFKDGLPLFDLVGHGIKHPAASCGVLTSLSKLLASPANAPRGGELNSKGLKLKGLLIGHLLTEDMRYRDFMLSQNLPTPHPERSPK